MKPKGQARRLPNRSRISKRGPRALLPELAFGVRNSLWHFDAGLDNQITIPPTAFRQTAPPHAQLLAVLIPRAS